MVQPADLERDWLFRQNIVPAQSTLTEQLQTFVLELKRAFTGETFSFAKIRDFTIGKDQILLDSKIFKALDPGALSSDAFAIGKSSQQSTKGLFMGRGRIVAGEVGRRREGPAMQAEVRFDHRQASPRLRLDKRGAVKHLLLH